MQRAIFAFIWLFSSFALADCESFIKASTHEKIVTIFDSHVNTLMETWVQHHGGGGDYDWTGRAIARGENFGDDGRFRRTYIKDYIGHWVWERASHDFEAIKATASFLSPDINEKHGYRALKPTFERECETIIPQEVKKVHALGTFGQAEMKIFAKAKVLGSAEEVNNPYTGLLSPSEGRPLFVRFSIANPIAHTIKVLGGKSLSLEFIPGVGFKFPINGKRSVDLVAMYSLAGQGASQNFFQDEFSPDFSANAPEFYNTGSGAERAAILARYRRNPINAEVMTLVGHRFAEVIPAVYPGTGVVPNSNIGPHPFSISIADLAAFNDDGTEVAKDKQKRPWRLVFKPSLRSDSARKITDPTAYVPGKLETDFRYKLGFLEPGDKVFDVIAESRTGKRHLIGEIVMVTAVVPSRYADKIYFAQHKIEMARITGETIQDL